MEAGALPEREEMMAMEELSFNFDRMTRQGSIRGDSLLLFSETRRERKVLATGILYVGRDMRGQVVVAIVPQE